MHYSNQTFITLLLPSGTFKLVDAGGGVEKNGRLYKVKGSVSVISCDSPCKEGIPTVHFKLLIDH